MKEVFGGARVVTLACRSLAKSRRFWVERLGFSLLSEQSGSWVLVNLGNFRLRLVPHDDAHAPRGGGVALTFRSRHLARTAKELGERGVAFESHTAPSGDWLETADPDGHRVLFVERV